MSALAVTLSLLPALPAQAQEAPTTSDLLLTEYIEGSSFNKAIEIYNGTGTAVDLTAYDLELYSNGNTEVNTALNLGSLDLVDQVLPSGDALVVANSQAESGILDRANGTSGVANFNGNDALVLVDNSDGRRVVDSFGQVGDSSSWSSNGVSTTNATLRRNGTTPDNHPSNSFDPSAQWDAFAQDSFDDLGNFSPSGDGTGPDDGSAAAWINEFHYDNTGGDVGEFVEIAFTDGLDISGYQLVLYNGNGGATYGTESLADATVSGPEDGVDFAVFEVGVQNGSPDGLALIDADGSVVEFLSYEGTFTAVGGPADGLTSVDIGVEQGSSTPSGASLQLQGTGSVAADFTWAALDVNTKGGPNFDQTIGDLVGPSTPTPPDTDVCEVPEEDITRIHTIQGDGDVSPLAGDPVFTPGPEVTIRAVVTLADPELEGFFVQEAPENEDGNPDTSEGLFIDGAIPNGVEPGDTVAVTGGPKDNFDRTELEATAVEVCNDPLTTIEPIALPLPSSASEREPFENMLVTATDLVVSGTFTAYSFGELITGYQGELPSATEVAAPGEGAGEAAEEIKAREVILDDRLLGELDARSIWDADPERRLGDVIPEVTGVLDYSFDNYKIQYTEFPEFELFGAPEVPRLDEGNDIAAFNVLNYFNEFGDSSRLRGARDQEQFDLQTAKIVDTILELDATVLGLIELQNDYLDEFDGDPDTVPSVSTLVDALNEEAGEDRYDYVRIPEDRLATEGLNGGGVGTDAIANGIIYQPAEATQVGEASTFDINAGLSADPDKNRWPFAASFEIDGQLATVAVNHFKSKGSSCENVIGPDFSAGDDDGSTLAGNCDLTRQYAANALVEWIDTDPTGADTDNVFLVGDFNSYAQEAPIRVMKDAGYLNMVEELADGAFTYKFSGRVGTLDYIMASEGAAEIVDEAAVWQTNSRASYVDLYFIDDDTTVDSGNLPKGASDHDPVVVSLEAVDAPDADGPTVVAPDSQDEDSGGLVFVDSLQSFSDLSAQEIDACLASLSDVVLGSTFANSICAVSVSGLVEGFDDGTFGGELLVTREQAASMIARALDEAGVEPDFSDVIPGSTHAASIGLLQELGIFNGQVDGTFGPQQPLTRGQMASVIAELLELDTSGTSSFPDVTPDNVHAGAIAALEELDIALGFTNGVYGPEEPITRNEFVAILARAFGLED